MKTLYYYLLLPLAFVFSGTGLFAQTLDNDNAELVTDRPDQTESSITVPHKSLQIETGFVYESDETDAYKETTTTYSTTLLRYGVLKNAEIRVGFDYNNYSYEPPVSSGDNISETGFSPLLLGIKTGISEQNGIVPEMALLTHLILPNSANETFEQQRLTPEIILSASYGLTSRLSTGINFGASWDDTGLPAGIYSWVLGIAINDKTGAFLETYGTFAEDTDFDNRIDGGFTFLLLNNLQIDIAGGIGLTDISPDYFAGGGLSWRIPH